MCTPFRSALFLRSTNTDSSISINLRNRCIIYDSSNLKSTSYKLRAKVLQSCRRVCLCVQLNGFYLSLHQHTYMNDAKGEMDFMFGFENAIKVVAVIVFAAAAAAVVVVVDTVLCVCYRLYASICFCISLHAESIV